MTEAPSDRLRQRLLPAMLEVAAAKGWTASALADAAKAAGMNEGEAFLAAPNGPIDLIDAFALWADDQMAARLAAAGVAGMKVRARVTYAVRARLEALEPHRAAMRRSVAAVAMAGPSVMGAALGPGPRLAWRTADRIWRELGDTSTDGNYYSKRMILSGVHAATLARWLIDNEAGTPSTWALLDRQIDGVMQFEKLKAQLRPLAGAGEMVVGGLARLRYGLSRP